MVKHVIAVNSNCKPKVTCSLLLFVAGYVRGRSSIERVPNGVFTSRFSVQYVGRSCAVFSIPSRQAYLILASACSSAVKYTCCASRVRSSEGPLTAQQQQIEIRVHRAPCLARPRAKLWTVRMPPQALYISYIPRGTYLVYDVICACALACGCVTLDPPAAAPSLDQTRLTEGSL